MIDYIDRFKLIEAMEAYQYDAGKDGYRIMTLIGIQPTADVAPVRHGRWIETKNGFHCSNCKRKPGKHPTKRGVLLSDYCPNCGARMDKED